MLAPLLLAAAVSAAPPDTAVIPLREVVVTGTRTPESALRLPAGVSIVKREAFADTRGNSLKDALEFVPGVFAQSRGGGQDVRITIRGFGARGNGDRSNAGNIRGIRIMTDGIPVTEPDGRSSLDLVDLGAADRVEVVRSNASVLYGNASGGVLHLRTDTDFDRPFTELRQRAGSFGYHREQALTGFTLGPARGVLSLLNSTFDGWRRHSESNGTQASLRLRVPVGERHRLGLLLDGVSNLNRFPGALTRAQADSAPEQANPAYVARDERRRNRVGRFAATYDGDLGGGTDLSVAAYAEPKVLQRSERNRFRDFTRYHLGASGTLSWRRDLSPELRSHLSVGGDEAFQDGAILFYNQVGGARGTTVVANKREAANSYGVFVEEELLWRERWSLRIAGRYDMLWYISEDFTDPALDAAKRFERVTPKASLSYRTGEHTVYVALGGGVEAPAFNEIDPPPTVAPTSLNPFLEPMYSTTFEGGVKGGHAAPGGLGRLDYDAALYWIEVRNEVVPYNGGAYFFTAGESRRRGGELGLAWRMPNGLRLNGSLTVSDNAYVDYANDLGDFGGNEVPGLPRVQYMAGAHYEAPLGLYAEAAVEGAGRFYADDANTSRTKSYAVVNATIGAKRSFERGTVSAFVGVNNLADAAYDASVFINGVTGIYFEPGLPRNWVAGLTVRGF